MSLSSLTNHRKLASVVIGQPDTQSQGTIDNPFQPSPYKSVLLTDNPIGRSLDSEELDGLIPMVFSSPPTRTYVERRSPARLKCQRQKSKIETARTRHPLVDSEDDIIFVSLVNIWTLMCQLLDQAKII
ncbi:6891_t:CDS:1 [Paraglomus brasilianum]|uniref:6891_t:CDS:1 n=1 Tax=Paraglomus brasilianum TaxID=144538 RepID=A0A9N9BW28_9GLOM|nr:6891_t:CDS:1 [Paraglomus brasilianum]